MARAKSAAPLSLADISDATRRLLKNASELIAEAELLCRHSHFARSFALSVIAIEEASKILILLDCARKIAGGEKQDWIKIEKALNSHAEKLKANLLLFRSQRLGEVPAVGSAEWQDAVARVTELNLLKQAALYVWIGEGGPLTTTEHISEDVKAETAIKLAKISYDSADLLGREFQAKQTGSTVLDLRTRFP